MFPVAYATGRTVSSARQAGGLKGYAPVLDAHEETVVI